MKTILSKTKYPIYVISKGRWELRHTSKALEAMGVSYRIVIESQEYDQYSSVIDKEKILVLPFSNLGQGSIPARNWVWQHSIENGNNKRHWILDDNIDGFYRRVNGQRVFCESIACFLAIEDFVDRYKNIGIAGMQYSMFVPDGEKRAPYVLNTRVYSCILLDNSLKHRWRGRYNEDTDLSIRILKDKYCSILFNVFLCNKLATMKLKGGNTDELYKQDDNFDGRLEMAKSLKEQHPEIVEIKRRWGRWQHVVNYKPFKNNKLIRKRNLEIKDTTNEYGMKLKGEGKFYEALLEKSSKS